MPTEKIGSMVLDSSFGQLCALASALSFAFASIAISSNKRRGLSNDGAFLSVIMTVLFSFALFLVFEDGDLPSLDDPKLLEGILWFCMAGLFAMAPSIGAKPWPCAIIVFVPCKSRRAF